MQSAGGVKASTVLLSHDPYNLQYQPAMQDVLTHAMVHDYYGSNQLFSYCIWGLLHNREFISGTVTWSQTPWLQREVLGPKGDTFYLLLFW